MVTWGVLNFKAYVWIIQDLVSQDIQHLKRLPPVFAWCALVCYPGARLSIGFGLAFLSIAALTASPTELAMQGAAGISLSGPASNVATSPPGLAVSKRLWPSSASLLPPGRACC